VPSCKRAFGALCALADSSRSEAVGRRLSAERRFGAVCRELGVHRSASTLHVPWAVIASSPASGSRVVSVILSSPSIGLRQKESHVHREPGNWRMSSTLTRPHSIRRTDDKALAARFVACTPSSIPSGAITDITRSTDGVEDHTLNLTLPSALLHDDAVSRL
jgi:hypothetical protein